MGLEFMKINVLHAGVIERKRDWETEQQQGAFSENVSIHSLSRANNTCQF